MNRGQIERALEETFRDQVLTRTERKDLASAFGAIRRDEDRAFLAHRAFDLARGAVEAEGDLRVLDWLEDVVKLLNRGPESSEIEDCAEVHFSPSDDGPRRIIGLLEGARRSVEICVFTITDDRITEAILRAHGRGVSVRIISDDDKSGDLGSDVDRLLAEGVPARRDRSEFHMHHKFAIFDRARLLSGSFNWTRGASQNHENFIVTSNPHLIGAFVETFEHLWVKFA